MGQKIHPTGFRIGVSQKQNSTWFASYSVFSEVLKEDYQVRQSVKKEFFKLYNEIGIAKLEIKRKVNELELFIYAANPILISLESNQKATIETLHSKLKKLSSTQKKIKIKVFQVSKVENESSLIAIALAEKLERRVPFKKVIRQVAKILQKRGVKGFKIQISGRLNGIEIARTEWVREGRVPLQTLRADISYATQKANTIYGVLGLKVWIFNKEII